MIKWPRKIAPNLDEASANPIVLVDQDGATVATDQRGLRPVGIRRPPAR
jgi:hypothetical protein